MSEVYIDGKLFDVDEVNPEYHKFIGMFRQPYQNPHGIVICPCGKSLEYLEITYDHWLRGHWDYPQYVTIKKLSD